MFLWKNKQDKNEKENLAPKIAATRKHVLDIAKQQFSPANPAESIFWEMLELDIEFHVSKSEQNRRQYFGQNTVANRLSSFLDHRGKAASFLRMAVQMVLLTTGLFSGFRYLQSQTGIYLWVSLGELVLFAGSFLLDIKRSQLKLRRYGETWVRHSAALSQYDLNLMRFISGLPPYDALLLQIRKQRFQDEILSIQQQNQRQFEENMKNLEETIR